MAGRRSNCRKCGAAFGPLTFGLDRPKESFSAPAWPDLDEVERARIESFDALIHPSRRRP